jgi:hypothetical protein
MDYRSRFDHGATLKTAAHLDQATPRRKPLVHPAQAKPQALLSTGRRASALPVVGNDQAHAVAPQAQRHFDLACSGVLHAVVERLLRNTVQRCLESAWQPSRRIVGVAAERGFQIRAHGGVPDELLESGRQTPAVQSFWSQIGAHRAQRRDQVIHGLLPARHGQRLLLLGTRPQLAREQDGALKGIIVDVERDAATFLLDQMSASWLCCLERQLPGPFLARTWQLNAAATLFGGSQGDACAAFFTFPLQAAPP